MLEPICNSEDLAERGKAVVWDVTQWGRPARAFALRFEGRVVAYRNACPHTGGELDWNERDFLDADGQLIVCATHGALFEPASGRCVAGPCRGATLEAVAVFDDGESVVAAE
jgi:nitrite reductase/ring-hydroxylating ferredoxin subunit